MRLISSNDLDLAAQAVAAGEIVVLPTRRWYMICANALDHDACTRIFAGKSRPLTKPLALVLPHIDAADDLFVTTPHSRQLASAFWPGDLAMILRWRDSGIAQMHAPVGAPNALVTMDPELLGELARRSSVPVAATTANISDAGKTDAAGPAITTAEVERFVAETGTAVTYCVDGGICPLANHLTIVDCTELTAKIVRSGVVHDRAVHAAIAVIEPQPSRG